MTSFKHHLSFSAGLCLLSHALYAVNPVNGWYVGLIAGGSKPNTANFTTTSPLTGTAVNSSLSFSLGGDVGGQLGYRCDQWRFELEGLYNYNSHSKLNLDNVLYLSRHDTAISTASPFSAVLFPGFPAYTPIRFNGNTQMGAGFINGFYDIYQFDGDLNFIPYLGLGIGYASISNIVDIYLNDIYLLNVKHSHGSAAGQAMVGAQYFFDDTASIGLDYRFIATRGFNFNNNVLNTNGGNLYVNTLNLTLNYSFESNLNGA